MEAGGVRGAAWSGGRAAGVATDGADSGEGDVHHRSHDAVDLVTGTEAGAALEAAVGWGGVDGVEWVGG